MIDSAKVSRYFKIALPVLLLTWSFVYLTTTKETRSNFLRPFRSERKLFVSDFLEHEIDGSFDGSGIQDICDNQEWQKGLVLTCEPPLGGIGWVKNSHLTCVRAAMEFGAELVLPTIVKRVEADISQLIVTHAGPRTGISFDYLFDKEHFNQTLAKYCPQMKIHETLNAFHDTPGMGSPLKISLDQLDIPTHAGTIWKDAATVGDKLRHWLDEQSPPKNRKYPLRIHMGSNAFKYPVEEDIPRFHKNFGRIIRVREDCRKLAAVALFNMAKMFGLQLDLRKGITTDSFVGVHLRTEEDVDTTKSPDYETQAANYLTYIVENDMKIVYLATGASQDNITAFTERAKDFQIKVVTKKDILEPEDLGKLHRLTWDQRALVDYEVMLRAGLVTGVTQSVFAWNLAMRRRRAYGVTPPEKGGGAPSDTIQWADQFTTLYGNSPASEKYELGIWP